MSAEIIKSINFNPDKKQVISFPDGNTITLEVEKGELTLERAIYLLESAKFHIQKISYDD